MVRILFVSDNEEKVEQYRNAFDGCEVFAHTDETVIADFVAVTPPDIILADTKISVKIKSDAITLPVTDEMDTGVVAQLVNKNLRVKNSLDALSNTNKDLADSLYRLNTLYDTSSRFAGVLDKTKLVRYMIEGLDRALSFSLCSVVLNDEEPVWFLNSIYDLSDELVGELKTRANHRSKPVKTIKNPDRKFTFDILNYDSMTMVDDFGTVEVLRENHFTDEDRAIFQTIVAQAGQSLKGAQLYQKVSKLEKLKSEFISIVSHELRTPLTSIKNSLDILHKCGTSEAEKFITMAQRNVERLGGIINDLLDLSKIEAGKMDFQFKDTDIHSVIEYVKSTLSSAAREKELNLIVEEAHGLPPVHADSRRLEQVLTNLVSNAVKFTDSGKNIRIKTALVNARDIRVPECFAQSVEKLDGDYVLITVEDDGIGLAEKDFMQAFDKFSQIENTLSRNAGGTGLGLPIAKQLVEAHHGAIWCEGEVDNGAKFFFAIPIKTCYNTTKVGDKNEEHTYC